MLLVRKTNTFIFHLTPIFYPFYLAVLKHTDMHSLTISWTVRVQELCESQGGRPGPSVLMSLTVSVDVKQHWTMLRHWSQFVPNNYVNRHPRTWSSTSPPLWPGGKAGKQKDLCQKDFGLTSLCLWLSSLQKLWFIDTATLPLTIIIMKH